MKIKIIKEFHVPEFPKKKCPFLSNVSCTIVGGTPRANLSILYHCVVPDSCLDPSFNICSVKSCTNFEYIETNCDRVFVPLETPYLSFLDTQKNSFDNESSPFQRILVNE